MNRVKLWVFTVLAVGAGAAWLYVASGRMATRSIESIDARLRAARALVETRARLLGREGAAIAAAAARDPTLLSALTPPKPPPPPPRGRRAVRPPPPPPAPADPLGSAEAAVIAAAQAVGMDPARTMLAGLAHESKLSLRSAGHDVKVEDDASALSLLAAAKDGRARDALVRVQHSLFYATAHPAAPGAAVVVGLPLDGPWAQSIHADTGADVTMEVDEKRVVSTTGPSEAKALLEAAGKPSQSPVSVGDLGPVKVDGLAPAVPLLFAKAPRWRAQALALPDVSGTVVLSRSTRPQLAPIAIGQQVALLGLAGLLILGLVLGLLMKSEPPLAIPRDLLVAADRIAHGEFDVRVPMLAGQLGTITDALSRAVEAAAAARKRELHPAEVTGPGVAEATGPGPLEAAAVPAAEAPFFQPAPPLTSDHGEPTARDFFAGPAPSEVLGEEAAPPSVPSGPLVAEPVPAAAQEPAEAAPAPSAELPAASVVESRPPPPAPEPAGAADADDQHWRQVFEEFVLLRRQCGEPADGLTFEKFREKLQKNRDGLVEKYGCKAVRFQAYVKDGKAALKATPVR